VLDELSNTPDGTKGLIPIRILNEAHANLKQQLSTGQTTRLELEREPWLSVLNVTDGRSKIENQEKGNGTNKKRLKTTKKGHVLTQFFLSSSNPAYTHVEQSRTSLCTLRITLSTIREELADLQDAHYSLRRTRAQTIVSQKSQNRFSEAPVVSPRRQGLPGTSPLVPSKILAGGRE